LLTAAHGSFAPAIATIGSIYFVGLIIRIFARETKGQALPDSFLLFIIVLSFVQGGRSVFQGLLKHIGIGSVDY
jgi:hypothetical protein